MASHDLKAPLNAFNEMLGWIEEDCNELIPEDSREHLGLLKKRSQRMKRLLDDLLAYSRINRFEYTNERVHLKEIVADTFYLVGSPSGFSCIAADIELNIPRIPFEIVLRNLISNAIKHHDKDKGEILITYAPHSGFHQITVQDDGPGIPRKLQSKVLEMFKTLKPRDQVEGSGMGLAIVNKIIEYHGGSLHIDSNGERGTGFIIQWPKAVIG